MMQPGPHDVLAFWFGTGGATAVPRPEWFRKDPAFDESIRARFGGLVEVALRDAWDAAAWPDAPEARLARVVVLDQFPRNLYRGSPKSFAGDRRALELAQRMVDDGEDALLAPLQRWFAYLPFEHAEDLAAQDRSVALFEALAEDHADLAGALDYAVRHRDVIRRFGRFPHRNEVLGRTSSPEELEFLRQPGSRF